MPARDNYWSSLITVKLRKLAYNLAKPTHNTDPAPLNLVNANFDSLTTAIMGRVRTKVYFYETLTASV